MKERPVVVVVDELNLRPDDYALALLTSSERNEPRANELISEFSIDWPLERIALVDRLVMTLGGGRDDDGGRPAEGRYPRRGRGTGEGLLDRRVA